MATFWPSNSNKLQLEQLIYQHISDTNEPDQYPIVLGQVTNQEEYQCIILEQGQKNKLEHLQSTFEKADIKIILHVLDSLRSGHFVCYVVSNDTDVLVALLYHMPYFLQLNLKGLWVRAGVGDTTRHVPLHTLYERLGKDMCAVLPAVHSLTGCDITSKIGAKKAALKAQPEKFLKNFGRTVTLSESVLQDAEHFLVRVVKSRSNCKNFSELRSEIFHSAKASSHQNLPPTSQGLQPHIQRAFFNAYTIMHVEELQNYDVNLRPVDFGFKVENECLLPETSWKTLELHWTTVCTCLTCARASCLCRIVGMMCTRFCKCKEDCKNPIK